MSDREEHLRRMLDHGHRAQQKAAEFEEQVRRVWLFFQSAEIRDPPSQRKEADTTT